MTFTPCPQSTTSPPETGHCWASGTLASFMRRIASYDPTMLAPVFVGDDVGAQNVIEVAVADEHVIRLVDFGHREPTCGAAGMRSRNVSSQMVTPSMRKRNVVVPNHSRVRGAGMPHTGESRPSVHRDNPSVGGGRARAEGRRARGGRRSASGQRVGGRAAGRRRPGFPVRSR